MKSIISIISLIIIGFILQSFLPWWIIVFTAIIVGIVAKMGGTRSFGIGFLSIALLWGVYAGWIDQANAGRLSSRMGELFGGIAGYQLILIVALVGGILGGMGMLTGSLARKLVD